MTMQRSGFANTLAPGFRKIVFETYTERPIEGSKLVNMNTSKKAYEEDFPIAGLGALINKPEGASIYYQDGIQGAIKRYTWQTFALGFRVTQEMYEDELYGVFGSKFSKSLGRSARNNKEVIMHSPFNNAFNTSYVGFTAGEALCGDHVTLRGATIRNRPATDVDFGLLALQAAVEHFHNLTDESGMPVLFIPKRVIHSVGDHWLVQQTLRTQQLPGGNLNDINQIANEGLTAHLSHYLTDTDAWFLQCDNHDINYFSRRPFKMRSGDDIDTGDAKYNGSQRHSAGFGDWRGIYGSQGG